MEEKKNLYKLQQDYGRMGFIQGFFLATPSKMESIMGTEVYFGEALGKHSEIFCNISDSTVKMISSDQSFIEKAVECGLVPNGYNPFNYLD